MVTMKYFATTLIYVQHLWRIMISEINEDFHVMTKSKRVAETIKHKLEVPTINLGSKLNRNLLSF